MNRKKMTAAAAAMLCSALSIQSVLLPVLAQEQLHPASTEAAKDETVIYASDFGADPTGTFDSTEAIQKAFGAAKEAKKAGAKAVRVEFEKGTYQIWKDKCEKRMAHTSNTSSTDGYGEKTIGLLIEDQEDLTVDGNGSLFMMHGNIMALAVIRSKNIVLNDFAWDFAVPTTSEMTIIDMGTTSAGKQYTDFYIPKTMPHTITGNTITWTSEKSIYTGETYWSESGIHWAWCSNANDPEGEFTRRYDTGADNPFSNVASISHVEGTDETVVRIVYSTSRPAMQKKGMTLELNANGRRETTGAFVWESENVTARKIDVHYMHGFGWLLQMSKDMYFYDCTMVPREDSGHLTTGYADGIHASGHAGEVVIENCRFASLHDDPINIHGTFTRVESMQDSHTLVLKNIHSQQGGYQQYFEGDKVQFFTRDTLESRDNETAYTVEEVISNPGEEGNDLKTMVVRFKEELPDFLTETYSGQPRFVAENVSYAPNVTIRGNTFRDLAARAVLCTSRGHVLVENNIFYDMTMDGYNTSNDANLWYESGPVRDVTIRNNTFYVTETGASHNNKVINIDPVTLGGGFPSYENPIHKNITIEGNTFYMGTDTVVGAWSVENLTIRNNKILRKDPNIELELPQEGIVLCQGASKTIEAKGSGLVRGSSIENMYLFKNCKNVQIEGNTYDAGQKLYAWYEGMPESEIKITNDAVTTTTNLNLPASAPVEAIHYTSSDPSIASIDDEGTITARKPGVVQVRAWTEWNGSIIESEPVSVTITEAQEEQAAPVIEQEDVCVLDGQSHSMQFAAQSDLPVSWSVTDLVSGKETSRASISEDGLLQVGGNALLKVTASSASGSDAVIVIANTGISDGINPAVSIINENAAYYSMDDTRVDMTMLKGDLYFWNNSIQNMVSVGLPQDSDPDHFRTVVYAENMPARESNQWDTLSFMLFNDLDNYITIGRKSHYDGITAVREVEQSGNEMGGSSADNALTSGWLGFTKEGSTVSLDYSADGITWNHLRDLDGAFLNGYKIGLGTWVTNERGKTAAFRDLKMGSSSVSYADLVQSESFHFNKLANHAPTVTASFEKDSYALADTAKVVWQADDADGDAISAAMYHYEYANEAGIKKDIWTTSDTFEVTGTGSLNCTVFAKDASGQYGFARTETISLDAGKAEGVILDIAVNGRRINIEEDEIDLLLPQSEQAISLDVLTDGALWTLNGQPAQSGMLMELKEDCNLVIATSTASKTLHIRKAASSKTALASISVPELDFAWSPADGALPVLVTRKPSITLQTSAEAGSVHLYNKLYGKEELASAGNQETAELAIDLSGGINTILIENRAEDGISYQVTKMHVVFMPETNAEAPILLNGQPVSADESGLLRFVLAENASSASLQILTDPQQSAKAVVNGQVFAGNSLQLDGLQPGANEVSVITTAADGICQKETRINVVVPYAQDAALLSVSVNGARLEDLNSEQLSAMIQSDTVQIDAAAQDERAIVSIENSAGKAAGIGSASWNAAVFEDDASVTIRVRSADGSTISTKTLNLEKACWMSDLAWDPGATIGYGSIHKDTAIEGTPLRLTDEAGQVVYYPKGIGSHADTSISWSLPADTYTSLEGVVGVDYVKYNGSYPNVVFKVLSDGTEVFNSGVMYGKTPGKPFKADLAGVSKVTLQATQAENSNWDAHADFAGLKLTMKKAAKAATDLDLTALQEALNACEEIEPMYQDGAKVQAWIDAVNAGGALLSSIYTGAETVSQQQVNEAADAILSALQQVIDSEAKANTMLLAMAVSQADLLKEQGALENVNPIVKDAFEARLANAKAILKDSHASQQAVNEAWSALCQAIQMLGFTSDKTLLASLIVQAEAVDPARISQAAREQLEEAIAFGHAVMDDPAALDAGSIKEAVEKLQAALEAASNVLDTTLLALLVEAVKDTDIENYIPSTTAEFTEALAEAITVLAAPQSQQQINDSTARLHTAWLNLRRKPDESLLAALAGIVNTLERSMQQPELSSLLKEEIEDYLDSAKQALSDPEADAFSIQALVEEGSSLISKTEQKQATQAAPSASRQSSTSSSVKTAFSTSLSGWMAAAAGALSIMLFRRKNRK